MQYPPLIFTHIPKTAGTTVNTKFILPHFANKTVLGFGGRRQFVKRVLKHWPKIDYVHGHAPYGLHRYGLWRADYFTMLRDPLDRAISEYYFARQSRYEGYYEHPIHADATRLGIVDFFARGGRDNAQTRYLGGFKYLNSSVRLTQSAFERAHANMHRYAFIGLKERILDSVPRIAALRAIPVRLDDPLPQGQRTHDRPAVDELCSVERDDLFNLHQFDYQLYAEAQATFWDSHSNNPVPG